ncbi:MAG: bifunctional UDP-N-acetylmuramoyl-tripeptide:D-alanyl-D-alanine ligase/alanine racemase [Bacteroidales bacterium]|nr:bifunctional UDP-N-acetylmuramoyl-tripeptide:D-alanyl-D-alanine ligase/alanine racemase [Bacteroidales bacterium]
MEYTLSQITKVISGELITKPATENYLITDILIDSRRLISPEHCLFFALHTPRNDGHRYISELYKKGVRCFVVSQEQNASLFPQANFIRVVDSLKALQSLASWHRKQFDIPVVGITGSNGKTIIKEWLWQLMHEDLKLIRSPKSYNSQIGVPLSVWQMKSEHELAIFEAGISETEEMDHLEKIIKPNIGIFTNIGLAHDKNFINHQQKAGEKLKLFKHVETLIYSLDYPDIQSVIIRSELHKKVKLFTWSMKQNADLKVKETRRVGGYTSITAVYKQEEIDIEIPFFDEASIENAIHCWAFMIFMNYSQHDIKRKMRNLHAIAMRLELKEGINNSTIINDSYNSDFHSLSIALDFMLAQHQRQSKTLILSDILQSSRNDYDLYTDVANLIEAKGIDKIIGIGPALSSFADRFKMTTHFFPDTESFLRNFPLSNFSNETILLKGARVFEFEKISKVLQRKAHETVLEIDLNALVHNLNYYRSQVKRETKIMGMVKAFSYGSGGYEIASVLQFHNVDYLAVAFADEGVQLRQAGINLPIMVMSPEESAFDAIIKHSLEPEIYNFRVLSMLENAIEINLIPDNKPVQIHLKLDTGMHRLGFMAEDVEHLICRIQKNPLIRIKSVFTHLAASENSSLDDFTREQIKKFSDLSEKIIHAFDYKILRHALNSAGITRHPEAHFDMVRLGISLYGVASDSNVRKQIKNVSTLKTTISQIKKIQSDNSVGYGRSFVAHQEVTIAILPIGYADGLSRQLGNGKGKVIIRGKEAPIIGNVCMDMCMVDVSKLKVNEGDIVEIFGARYPVDQLAKQLNTIPYEVLTSISSRVKRVYFQE